ncbi:MAG: hypothetical protein MI749_07175, partial [Desulfovibrionales bacterium]|nr:hypothetical protein [Desulfovibrionales bacterium]
MKIRLKSFTNLILILCLDIFLISGAYYFAHLIRFDFSIPGATLGLLFKSLISIVVIKLLIFVFFRLYKGMWRFTSLPDLFNILKASMVGSICLILFFLYFNRFEGFSRSIFIMDWFLSFLFVTASRVAIRIYYEIRPLNWFQLKKTLCRGDRHSIFGDVKNIILIGIDHTAEGLCREIQNNRALNYKVMGFVGINST